MQSSTDKVRQSARIARIEGMVAMTETTMLLVKASEEFPRVSPYLRRSLVFVD